MSTRGFIAMAQGDGFTGRYHHWDSYPEGLGLALWKLYHGTFRRDIGSMRRVLLEEHPAGWSTIVGKSFKFLPGFSKPGARRPQCYCHGVRREPEQVVTEADAARIGCEYGYLLEADALVVLSSHCQDGVKMVGMFGAGDPAARWVLTGRYPWNGEAPHF